MKRMMDGAWGREAERVREKNEGIRGKGKKGVNERGVQEIKNKKQSLKDKVEKGNEGKK